MIERKDDRDTYSVSIARQPVFDNKGRLWGYELFCVGHVDMPRGGIPDQSETAINVASSAYLCLQQILQGGKKIIIDFTEKSILDKLPYVLPPVCAAIKVGEESGQQPSSMETLDRLKLDGYLIAIRGFSGNPACESLYRLADIIAIETRERRSEEIQADLERARQYNALLLACEVQDRKLYEICRGLGFSIFSGPFFKYPDKLTVRKLSSNETLRFKLLKFIESEDPDIGRIAEAIQSDATISFRLLAFLNSAAFAFSQKIRSIHQAISLLGWSSIKNWLRVVLLTDMTQSKEAEELVLLSAQRGMFLELVAREHDYWGFDPESMHLLGIFSLLDALLALPMAEIVAHLPIDNKMKSALCREANNEYAPLLSLAQRFEEARWSEVEAIIQQLNLDNAKVRAAFQKSVNWASELEALRSERPTGSERK
jgi:EAL and modified HD-GYP domain-containing signal transduction protein